METTKTITYILNEGKTIEEKLEIDIDELYKYIQDYDDLSFLDLIEKILNESQIHNSLIYLAVCGIRYVCEMMRTKDSGQDDFTKLFMDLLRGKNE